MRTKQVVLLSSRSLFAAGVQRLLQDSAGIELSTVAADEPEWVAKIRQLAPQVIVMDSNDASLDQGTIAQLLEEHPQARVVTLNLIRAGIDVYRMERVRQTDLDGLLEAIQGKGVSTRETRGQRATGAKIANGGGTGMVS